MPARPVRVVFALPAERAPGQVGTVECRAGRFVATYFVDSPTELLEHFAHCAAAAVDRFAAGDLATWQETSAGRWVCAVFLAADVDPRPPDTVPTEWSAANR